VTNGLQKKTSGGPKPRFEFDFEKSFGRHPDHDVENQLGWTKKKRGVRLHIRRHEIALFDIRDEQDTAAATIAAAATTIIATAHGLHCRHTESVLAVRNVAVVTFSSKHPPRLSNYVDSNCKTSGFCNRPSILLDMLVYLFDRFHHFPMV
jgi:hypothetical protein